MSKFKKSTMLTGCSLFFILFLIAGCGMRPITSGSQSDLPYYGSRVVVWGSHTGATGEAVNNLQKMKQKIVERARLQQVFDEQKITLSYGSDDEGKLLKVGKLVGADTILFVDVQTSSDVVSSAAAYKYYASSHTGTQYHLSVSVRNVSVETGEVIWSGSAHYPRGINNPEAGIIYLTRAAMLRALCPDGAWDDMFGCNIKKAAGDGWLGIYVQQKYAPEGKQLVVADFPPGSPARTAGITVGDIVFSCNGLTGLRTLLEMITTCKPKAGAVMTIEVLRGDKKMTFKVTAGARPGIKQQE